MRDAPVVGVPVSVTSDGRCSSWSPSLDRPVNSGPNVVEIRRRLRVMNSGDSIAVAALSPKVVFGVAKMGTGLSFVVDDGEDRDEVDAFVTMERPGTLRRLLSCRSREPGRVACELEPEAIAPSTVSDLDSKDDPEPSESPSRDGVMEGTGTL